MKFLIFFIMLTIIPCATFGFEGDYIWEDKFKRQLPKAEKGNAKAQYAIGDMYNRGRGIEKNATKAFEWFSKSANQGNKKAAYKIGYAYLQGKGTGVDFEKAMKWLKIASNKGYERAHFYLGEIYELGKGVDKDLNTALKWYKKADSGGFNPASKRIIRVNEAIAEQTKSTPAQKSQTPPSSQIQPTIVSIAKVTAQKVSIKKRSLTTEDKILQGGWKKRNKPSEYLPSEITECVKSGESLECQSKKLSRNIGVADIHYTTKALVFGINATGTFKISYRNNVLDVQITDPEFAESGSEVPVKTGWQDAKHTLECKLNGNNAISCKKDKIRSIKISR